MCNSIAWPHAARRIAPGPATVVSLCTAVVGRADSGAAIGAAAIAGQHLIVLSVGAVLPTREGQLTSHTLCAEVIDVNHPVRRATDLLRNARRAVALTGA